MARGYDENKPVRIWVGSYGLYNAGYLAGDWFSLPMDRDELWAGINDACHVSPTNEEVGCFDYECDIDGVTEHMSEYMSIDSANALAAAIEHMDECMDEGLEAWIGNECDLTMLEIASAAMDAENIPFYSYEFDGYNVTYEDGPFHYNPTLTMSAEEKYGRTLAYIDGLTEELEKFNVECYFDYEHYGRDNYDVVLCDNGYLSTTGSDPDTNLYTNALELLEELGYYVPTDDEVVA